MAQKTAYLPKNPQGISSFRRSCCAFKRVSRAKIDVNENLGSALLNSWKADLFSLRKAYILMCSTGIGSTEAADCMVDSIANFG